MIHSNVITDSDPYIYRAMIMLQKNRRSEAVPIKLPLNYCNFD